MCTVSYLPLRGGYALTSNRDEDPGRKTGTPQKIVLANGRTITCPRDLEKGGSWIAADDLGRTSCLLNGAFGKHRRQPAYRISRGQLVLKAFEAADFDSFAGNIMLEGIEPFTQLFVAPGQILKMVWDGSRKYLWELSSESVHLWSSPTLYSPAQHAEKEQYFKESLLRTSHSPELALKIHGREGNTPFVLSRQGVRTVSITQVHSQEAFVRMSYIPKDNVNEKAVSISTPV